jgi:hypothetical protein
VPRYSWLYSNILAVRLGATISGAKSITGAKALTMAAYPLFAIVTFSQCCLFGAVVTAYNSPLALPEIQNKDSTQMQGTV